MIILIFLLSTFAFAAEDLSSKILSLRSEVEEAGNAIDESRRQRMANLDVLLQRKNEVELSLRKERLKTLQLQEKRKHLSSLTQSVAKKSELDSLVVWAKDLKATVNNGIPFRKEERLEAIDAVAKRIEAGRESPVSLATELWTLTEKELKMAGGNEYRLMKMKLANKEVDAEVARIGTIQTLFRSSSGELGYAKRSGSNWEWTVASSDQQKAIDRLMNQFRDKSYSGWFELPGLSKGENL